jgi:CrcB protein
VKWWWVFAGGGLGAVLRYGLAGVVEARTGGSFPWGTLWVNWAGCLVIGVLWGLFEARGLHPGSGLRVFLFAGILGGFTTFSSFGLEAVTLATLGRPNAALAYVGASVVVGLALVAAGLALARGLSA